MAAAWCIGSRKSAQGAQLQTFRPRAAACRPHPSHPSTQFQSRDPHHHGRAATGAGATRRKHNGSAGGWRRRRPHPARTWAGLECLHLEPSCPAAGRAARTLLSRAPLLGCGSTWAPAFNGAAHRCPSLTSGRPSAPCSAPSCPPRSPCPQGRRRAPRPRGCSPSLGRPALAGLPSLHRLPSSARECAVGAREAPTVIAARFVSSGCEAIRPRSTVWRAHAGRRRPSVGGSGRLPPGCLVLHAGPRFSHTSALSINLHRLGGPAAVVYTGLLNTKWGEDRAKPGGLPAPAARPSEKTTGTGQAD